MNQKYYGLIEMAFSFGIVLVFAVWQLVSLNRDKKKTDKSNNTAPPKDDTN